MERKLRTCSCCGSSYRFCPRCPEDAEKPNWYFAFCSENCKDIYDVLSNYEMGHVSVSEAKSRLKKLDLSNKDNFGTSYKESIKKIMETEIKPVDIETIECFDDVVEQEVLDEPEKEEKNVFMKPKNKRAKRDVE